MRKITIIAGSALAIALAATSVFANSNMTMSGKSAKPCKSIRAACMAAGYTKGGKNGKGLMKDCMKPLMAGQQVQGVNVDSKDMQACQMKMKQKGAMMKKDMQQKMSNDNTSGAN